MGVRPRRIQANYLKIGEKYELIGAGFTELNESPSAQTTSKRYINQASASQSITGYEWSSSFTTDQIKSEKVIEFIREIGELQKTGQDTEALYCIVDLDQPAATKGFRARELKIAIAVNDFEDNDGELGISGDFLGISDVILGTFDKETNEFTEGFEPKTEV